MSTNKAVLFGDAGTGKTTLTANMMTHWLRKIAGENGLGSATDTFGWTTAENGFLFETVSPLSKAAMDALGLKKPPAKSLPTAVGAKGEQSKFRWHGEPWQLDCFPGEKVFTNSQGIDVPALVKELEPYRVVMFAYRAPLVTPTLGRKYVFGMTEVFQQPTLGYSLADAVCNAAELSFGLSRAGLAKRYPRELCTLRAHDTTTVKWNPMNGDFDVQAVLRERPVPPDAVVDAMHSIISGEQLRSMGSLLVRNVTSFVNDRLINVLTHVDIAQQFLPRVVTAEDYQTAFDWLWQGISHTSAQCVLAPNLKLELHPNLTDTRTTPAAEAETLDRTESTPKKKKKASRRRAVATIYDLDLTGAARVWSSIHQVANGQSNRAKLPARIKETVFDKLFGRRTRTSTNGTRS